MIVKLVRYVKASLIRASLTRLTTLTRAKTDTPLRQF